VRTREIITQIDPEIFGILFKDSGRPTEAEVARIVARAPDYGYSFGNNPPRTSDELYRQLSGFISAMIQSQHNEGGNLRDLIARVKSTHVQVDKINAQPIQMYPPVPKDSEDDSVSSGWVTS
jgi:hypothetical protein